MTSGAEPNVAVIGAGNWGRNHIRVLHQLGALAAICEAQPEIRDGISDGYPDVPVFSDPRAMFEQVPAIDAAVVATPSATHAEIARTVIAAGKHVLVEKPISLTVEDGLSVMRLADEKNVVLMVGHLLLYHPVFNALEDFVAKGGLGELRYAYSNRLNLGKIRKEENALWSFAPHDVSMLLRLFGAMPTRVVANGGAWLKRGVADTSLTHMCFPDGRQAHIFVSWLHPFKDHKLVLVGDRGMLVFDDVAKGPDKLLFFDHKVGWQDELPVVDKADGKALPYGSDEPLQCELNEFLTCIRTGNRPRSDGAEGMRVLSVLDACGRALVSGHDVVPRSTELQEAS